MPILQFIEKEITGLKEKQLQVNQQIEAAQKELQRLQNTSLVVSGALQALTHVVDQHQKEQAQMVQQQPPILPFGQSTVPPSTQSLQVPRPIILNNSRTETGNDSDTNSATSATSASSQRGEVSVEDLICQDPFGDNPDEEDE